MGQAENADNQLLELMEKRKYFVAKARKMMEDALEASLDNDNQRHNLLLDDLQTVFIIIWRTDREIMKWWNVPST